MRDFMVHSSYFLVRCCVSKWCTVLGENSGVNGAQVGSQKTGVGSGR